MELFLQELLEGWMNSGFTQPQMIDVLLRMLQTQAQCIHMLERCGG